MSEAFCQKHSHLIFIFSRNSQDGSKIPHKKRIVGKKVLNLIHYVCKPCVNINIWKIFKWSVHWKSSVEKRKTSAIIRKRNPDSEKREKNHQERDKRKEGERRKKSSKCVFNVVTSWYNFVTQCSTKQIHLLNCRRINRRMSQSETELKCISGKSISAQKANENNFRDNLKGVSSVCRKKCFLRK